jgi:hypothetical protein
VEWLNGQTGAAISTLDRLPHSDVFRGFYLPRIYAADGRYVEAADALREAPFSYSPGIREEAIRLLGIAPKPVNSSQGLPGLGNMEFVYLHVGAVDRLLDFFETRVNIGYSLNISMTWFWHPSYAPVRKTERFKSLVQNAGMVEYWRAKGWPEWCRPTTGDDFICK